MLFLALKCEYVFNTGKGSSEIVQEGHSREGIVSGELSTGSPDSPLKNERTFVVHLIFLVVGPFQRRKVLEQSYSIFWFWLLPKNLQLHRK